MSTAVRTLLAVLAIAALPLPAAAFRAEEPPASAPPASTTSPSRVTIVWPGSAARQSSTACVRVSTRSTSPSR